MKFLSLILAVLLFFGLIGCSTTDTAQSPANSTASPQVQPTSSGGSQQTAAQTTVPATSTPALLTRDEAQEIALKHAGFSANQVTRLRVEYDFDDGIPEYEVEFRSGGWEYDYTIHAQTGQILKSEKDRDD